MADDRPRLPEDKEQVPGFSYAEQPPVSPEAVARAAVGLAGWLPGGAAPQGWGMEEWQAAEWQAYWQGLSAWLAAEMDAGGMLAPAPVEQRLRAVAAEIRERTRRMLAGAAELLGTLGNAGVMAMPLKGALLAPLYYPDPGLRALGDLDILIHQRDLPAARQVLGRLGYRFFKRTDKDEAYLRGDRRALVWAADNVHPVELQYRAVYEFAGRTLDLTGDLWRWSRPLAYPGGVQCLAPDPAGTFSHVCTHASADWVLGQGKISQIQDLQVCAARMAGADWEALAGRLNRRAARFLYPAAGLAARLAPLAVPSEFLEWLRIHSPDRLHLWVKVAEPAAVFGLHSDQNIRRDFAAQVAGLFNAGRRDQAETLLRLLFPPRWHSRLEAYPRLVASPFWPLAWLLLSGKRVKKRLGFPVVD